MGSALKVRLLEFLLSLPLSACIVSVVWFGYMQNFFSLPIPQEEGEFFQDLISQPSEDANPRRSEERRGSSAASVLTEEPRVRLIEHKIESILAGNSTRARLGAVLEHLHLRGPGLETGLGANRGRFAEQILREWPAAKYYIVDPTPSASSEWSSGMQRMLHDGRVEMVDDYVEDAASRFPNERFSFVYINPTRLKKALEDWFPKLQDGGIIAGKDYCASMSQKASPEFGVLLQKRPWCGTYHGGGKEGKEKAGFGRYIQAVDIFAEEVGRTPHYTLEGRDPKTPYDSDGNANPTWWLVK